MQRLIRVSGRIRIPTRLFILWAAWAGVAGSTIAAEKALVQIDDLYRFDSPTEVTVRPDGLSAVYTRRWADRTSRTERRALWMVKGTVEDRQPLEQNQPNGWSPIYSPDGRWIAFLSSRAFSDGTPAVGPVPPYSDPAADIWLIPATGGRAIPLAGKSKQYGRVFSDRFYGRVAFSPNGTRLVFVADDGRDPRTPQEIANNVIEMREDQGEGYEGYRPAQIWVAELSESPADVAARKVVRVTDDGNWYGDPQWSPDGTSIFVHANLTGDRESVRYSINKNYDIWQIDLSTRERTQLTSGPGPEVSPRISADGSRLVCLSIPRKGSHFDVFNVMTLALGASGPRSQVLFNHHGPGTGESPHLPPSFPLPQDCWLDDNKIYFNAADGVRSRRQVLRLAAGPPYKAVPEHEVLTTRDRSRRQFTPPGNLFLRERRLASREVVRWKSFDESEIEGVLTLPPEGVSKRPYKMILYPHGGPHSRSSIGFNLTTEVFATNGYAVFQPNFRGSAGYGQKFLDADRFDLGGGDAKDIFTGIDQLVKEGIVDPNRQFVYGVSYGGFMTSWLIGHTNQFKAAAPQNAVTDLNAMWGLSDLQSWTEWEFGGKPWEVPDAMRAHSPLTYAANVKTPTLILHSVNDRRCPLPMGIMFYRALKSAGVETRMVLYPDEGHPINQLPHREDVLRRVLEWFRQHDSGAA